MTIPLTRNTQTLSLCKVILAVGLLFFSSLSFAQDEERKATIVVDSTEVIEPPVEDAYGDDITTTGNKYFYKKSDTLSLELRVVPGPVIKKIKGDKDFWYADAGLETKKKNEPVTGQQEQGQKGQKGQKKQREQSIKEEQDSDEYTPLGQQVWFQTILWFVIIGGFAVVLVMYLGSSNINLFRKKNVKANAETDEELITEDIFAINYQKEIDRAAAQGNYRLATRLMFLRLLKNMAEKNIILYKQDKTNLDYLLELHPTTYYKNFFRITRNYEYSWYGLFPVSQDAYQLIRHDFDQFEKELPYS